MSAEVQRSMFTPRLLRECSLMCRPKKSPTHGVPEDLEALPAVLRGPCGIGRDHLQRGRDHAREDLVEERQGEVAQRPVLHRLLNGVVELAERLGALRSRRGVHAIREEQPVEDLHLLRDRKSTRLNSSHVEISYAVFCL